MEGNAPEYPSVKRWRGITPVGLLSFPDLFEPRSYVEGGRKVYSAMLILDRRELQGNDLWDKIGQAIRHYGMAELGSKAFNEAGQPTFRSDGMIFAMNKPNIALPDGYEREHTLFLRCKSGENYPPLVLNTAEVKKPDGTVEEQVTQIHAHDPELLYPGRRATFQIGLWFKAAGPNFQASCQINLYAVKLLPGGNRFAGLNESERTTEAMDMFQEASGLLAGGAKQALAPPAGGNDAAAPPTYTQTAQTTPGPEGSGPKDDVPF